MNFDPYSSTKDSSGNINVLLSVLQFLDNDMQDEIVTAIESIKDQHLQDILHVLGEQYREMILQDYQDMNEYLYDMSLCQRFEDDELNRHHDPHADMMANIEI